jgi:hypothetical protein
MRSPAAWGANHSAAYPSEPQGAVATLEPRELVPQVVLKREGIVAAGLDAHQEAVKAARSIPLAAMPLSSD